MTITVQPTRNEYLSTASQVLFTYTFKIFAATDLNVFATPAGQVCTDSDLTTAYSVTGVGLEDGGTITFTTPRGVNDLITIVSNIASNRTTDYQVNGDFNAETVNDDFDRVVSLVKQAEELSNRTLVSRECQQGVKPLSLPEPVAGQYLRWNSLLTGMENIGVPTVILDNTPVSNVAALKALIGAVSGDVATTVGYSTNTGGGDNTYVARTATAGTDDGGSLIKSTGSPTIEWVGTFPKSIYSAKQWGPDGIDDSVVLQAAVDYVVTLGGGTLILDDFDFIYSKTLFLQDNVTLHIRNGATLRPKAGMGDVAGVGLFITIAAMSQIRFTSGSVAFKGAISAYQGPHECIKVINEGVIEGTLASTLAHGIADAGTVHIEQCTGFTYEGGGLIEKCDTTGLRFDGAGPTNPTWTTLALADTNTSIGHSSNCRAYDLRVDNCKHGFEVQNYVKDVTMANFSINDTSSHALRPTSARDVVSYGHYVTNCVGSVYQILEAQSYELYGSPHLESDDQIAIQIGEVDDIHIHGNHIVSGQLAHIGTGPNSQRVYVEGNLWGDENNEFNTANGLINPTSIDQLYVREVLPNNTAKTIFERKSIGVADLFRYTLSANQTGVAAGSFTKIQFNTKDFEGGTSYDPTTNFEAIPAKGTYAISAKIRMDDDGGTISSGDVVTISLFKSGTEHSTLFWRLHTGGAQMFQANFLVDANGGNTLDIRVDPGGTGTKQLVSGSTNTVFEMSPANP